MSLVQMAFINPQDDISNGRHMMVRMLVVPILVALLVAGGPLITAAQSVYAEEAAGDGLPPIFGRVTDARTGEPLGSVLVSMRNNITQGFTTFTYEDGSYEFTSAPRGYAYTILALPETHLWEDLEVFLGQEGCLEVNFTLLRPDTNVNVNVLKGFDYRQVQNASIELFDENGVSIRVLTSDGNGWANTTVADGRYSIRAFFDPLSSEEEYFEIESPKIEVMNLYLKPPVVSPDAIYSLFDEKLVLGPGKVTVLSFTASEPSSIYLVMSSSAPVVLMGCGGWFFQMTIQEVRICQDKNGLYHIPHSWLTDETRSMALPFEVPGEEYYLLILNYGSETAILDIELRYDFGNFERGSMDQYNTGQTVKSSQKEGPHILIIVAGTFGLIFTAVIILALVISIKRARKK